MGVGVGVGALYGHIKTRAGFLWLVLKSLDMSTRYLLWFSSYLRVWRSVGHTSTQL